MGTARLPNWRLKACADFDARQNISLLHYSHDNRTFYARFCWVGRLTPVHGRDVIPCSLLCSQAGQRLSQPFMRRPSRMLRPRREMLRHPQPAPGPAQGSPCSRSPWAQRWPALGKPRSRPERTRARLFSVSRHCMAGRTRPPRRPANLGCQDARCTEKRAQGRSAAHSIDCIYTVNTY